MDLNKMEIIGRMTREPELKYTTSGTATATFTVAVSRPQSKEARERGDKVLSDFFTVITWRAQAEACANYLKKGNHVYVEGRMQSRSYETDGVKKYVWELVADGVKFFPKNGSSSDSSSSTESAAYDEDDIPF